jgi:hypothetical protein
MRPERVPGRSTSAQRTVDVHASEERAEIGLGGARRRVGPNRLSLCAARRRNRAAISAGSGHEREVVVVDNR